MVAPSVFTAGGWVLARPTVGWLLGTPCLDTAAWEQTWQKLVEITHQHFKLGSEEGVGERVLTNCMLGLCLKSRIFLLKR